MKKLALALTVMTVAWAAHSAQIDWSIASKSFSAKDSSTTYNVTSYLLAFDSASAYSAFSTGVGNGTITFATAVSDYSVGSATGSTGKTAGKVETTLTSPKLTEGSEYQFAVFSTSGTDSYILSAASTGMAYDPSGEIETEGIGVSFSSTSFAAGWQTVTGGGEPVVPEPTSGLLLLVGGAMLALRRKQK